MSKFTVGETYTSAKGDEYEVLTLLATDFKSNYPMLLFKLSGSGGVVGVTTDGEFPPYYNDRLLLPKKEIWLNVYAKLPVEAYACKEIADLWAKKSRIACIKVEYEDGEGL